MNDTNTLNSANSTNTRNTTNTMNPANTTNTSESQDDFFVGYLPVPAKLSRWLRRITLLTLALVAAAAAAIAGMQRNPGDGVWNIDQQEAWEGVMIARPYPMLRMTRGSEMRTILLVSEGKVGGHEQAHAFDGKIVRVRGTLVKRDGRHLVELVNEPDAVVAIGGADAVGTNVATATPAPTPWQRVELRGEIIDPKCYLGAMKPGGGKTHKACATLCIRGGIPPMFVTRDAELRETFYLLTDAAGGPMLEPIVPFIGEPVELSGELEQWDDLLVIRIDAASVRRL